MEHFAIYSDPLGSDEQPSVPAGIDMPGNHTHTRRVIRVDSDADDFTEILCNTFVELEVSFNDSLKRVVAELEIHSFGDLELVSARVEKGGFIVSRTRELLATSVANSFFVSCVVSGRVGLSQEGRLIELRAPDIALLDSSREYSLAVNSSVDLLWIRVPRYRLEGRLAVPAEVMAQRINGRQGPGRLVSSLLHATLEEAERVSSPHAFRVSNALLDLLALSLDTSESSDRHRSDTVLRQVQNLIESNLSDPDLSLSLIAERQGVSVRYLNKLFEREGVSTARWIRLRRLERCRRDLESAEHGGRSISEIAYSHGFNDISSFNRAFKAHFGVSPRSVRPRQR
jgi:AraC-like DNA-binding protein